MRDPSEFRDDLWRPIMAHMRLRAGLTGTQTRDVLAFMQASNFQTDVLDLQSIATRTTVLDACDAEAVYNQTCIACHGADGRGALPRVPDFTAPNGPLGKSDDELLRHIIEGFKSPASSMMPARGGNPALTDEELAATLALLKLRFGK